MDLHADWEDTVLRAIIPQMSELAGLIQERIKVNAPVDTGALRDASYAEVDEADSSINIGVDSASPATNYARYVVDGHFESGHEGYVPANHYLETSVDEALQTWRVR